MPVHRQIAEKLLDLGLASIEIFPAAHPVEFDMAPNPVTITALGANGVVLEPHYFPHLVKQL